MNANAFEIISPVDTVYNSTNILLHVEHNETLQNISFSIDGSNYALLCSDCISDTAQLELIEGEHTIIVTGVMDNESYEESVTFAIELPDEEPQEPEITFTVEILSPESLNYNTTEISLEVEANDTLDSIDYELDGDSFDGCEDCSGFTEELNLTKGLHTITVLGQLGNKTVEDTVSFEIDLAEPLEFILTVIDPKDKTYDGEVDIKIESDKTLDEIHVEFEGYENSCDNCSLFEDAVNLSDGNYTLTVTGKLDDLEKQDSVDFEVDKPIVLEFDLDIIKPESEQYEEEIQIRVITNKVVNEIHVEFEGYEKSCDDCSVFEDSVTISEGNYTLTAIGKLGNVTDQESVSFEVIEVQTDPDDEADDDDDDDDNNRDSDGEPRFTLNLNKLPQAVASGNYDDDELADIIRRNRLNPGVINRLIKTGNLGEESIEAILDTQFKPRGILSRLLSWLGFRQPSYAELIYDEYDLPVKAKQKLVIREDLPKGQQNKLKAELEEEVKVRNKTSTGSQKSYNVGKQSDLPPGLAKKGVSGKVPPGQAKKGQLINQTSNRKLSKIPPGQAKKGR